MLFFVLVLGELLFFKPRGPTINMTYKDIFIQKKLPFNFWWLQYWPAEIMIQKGGDPVRLEWGENKKQRDWIKYFKMPWHRSASKREGLNESGAWETYPETKDWNRYKNFGMVFHFPVKYKMKYSDEVQEAWAEVKYTRDKRPHHWLRFVDFLYPWNYSIDISFDREMGSERGSWKGGVVGTSSEVRKGESILDSLNRRLEEQSFCRR